MKNLFYLFLAFLAYFTLSAGFVLQKKGIKFANTKDILIWITGFILMNLAPLINYFALKGISPSIVTASSGISVPLTIFLSKFILNTKIKITDYIYSILMMLFIFLANYFSENKEFNSFSKNALYFFVFLPSLLFLILIIINKFYKNKNNKIKLINTIIYSFSGGSLAGMMMIVLKIFQIEDVFSNKNFIFNQFFLLYLFLGITSFLSIQFAYRNGDILIVSPIQYGTQVFFPLLSIYFIFYTKIILIQVLSFILIILFAIKLVLSHKDLY
ncbi:MAG: hypothetical protein N3A58_06850 [Spirochaetes bacterium]|nr:hypothetical protein [Spirochaetota bacterium]